MSELVGKKRRRWIQKREGCTGSSQGLGHFCRELCEHLPGPHTSLLLGDAFMNIQEVSESLVALPSALPPPRLRWERETFGHFPHQPEKALEAYDEAYRKNPHDAFLVSRLGQAYVKTHQYSKVGGGGQPSREEGGRVHEWEDLGGSGRGPTLAEGRGEFRSYPPPPSPPTPTRGA